MSRHLPKDFERDFCARPERGLFRREYEGRTLRENLGLPRPENRFFDRSKSVAAE